MPSFKKVQKAQSAPHRERTQPRERKKLGILEKKKDYKIRVKSAHRQKATIKNLLKQAQARNPDEFFYNMITQSRERYNDDDDDDDDVLDDEQRMMSSHEKLLMTQDVNYVGYKLQIERKKIEKLEETIRLHSLTSKTRTHHLFFVDGKDKPIMPKRISKSAFSDDSEIKHRKGELLKRNRRLNELQIIFDKLSVENNLSSDRYERKKLIVNESKNHAAVYKWKPMRKK